MARDTEINPNKFYFWCYRNYKPNLLPISYYTVYQAKYTVIKTHGKEALDVLYVIKGSTAIRRKMSLGINCFYINRKPKWLPIYYIPPESKLSPQKRFIYRSKIDRRIKKEKSLESYYIHSHG